MNSITGTTPPDGVPQILLTRPPLPRKRPRQRTVATDVLYKADELGKILSSLSDGRDVFNLSLVNKTMQFLVKQCLGLYDLSRSCTQEQIVKQFAVFAQNTKVNFSYKLIVRPPTTINYRFPPQISVDFSFLQERLNPTKLIINATLTEQNGESAQGTPNQLPENIPPEPYNYSESYFLINNQPRALKQVTTSVTGEASIRDVVFSRQLGSIANMAIARLADSLDAVEIPPATRRRLEPIAYPACRW
jgi:hypothetical protein